MNVRRNNKNGWKRLLERITVNQNIYGGKPIIWGRLAVEHVHKEGRILVTLDKDFRELAIVHDTPHSGILRIVNFPAQKQETICQHVLNKFEKVLQSGAVVTAEQYWARSLFFCLTGIAPIPLSLKKEESKVKSRFDLVTHLPLISELTCLLLCLIYNMLWCFKGCSWYCNIRVIMRWGYCIKLIFSHKLQPIFTSFSKLELLSRSNTFSLIG